jgi:hypothetical protein
MVMSREYCASSNVAPPRQVGLEQRIEEIFWTRGAKAIGAFTFCFD